MDYIASFDSSMCYIAMINRDNKLDVMDVFFLRLILPINPVVLIVVS